ncbi:MAG: TIGR00296 family protein [Candidatus Bathyarchaeia archaeon]
MPNEFSLEDGRFLVKLARRAIGELLRTSKRISPPGGLDEKFLRKRGVFTTLTDHESGELRGCIGFPFPTNPLIEAVIDSAIEAATGDPRFPPVTLEELEGRIVLELSILTDPEPIRFKDPRECPSMIEIGEDGLIVERGWAKGLLLPQVAVEWGWDPEEFLSNCCIKAGLPPDAWLMGGTKIYKFRATIFSEKSPNGEVFEKRLKSE